MTSILLVTSSPRAESSHSTRVANDLAHKLSLTTNADIVVRDLVANAVPHITSHFAAGIYTPAEDQTTLQAEAVAASDALVEEIVAADIVVVSTGLFNFGISSNLKSWIDNIARAGKTFSYGEAGPQGLLTGKKVYLVIASGGVYSAGPASAFDHAIPYLKTVFGFLGMTDIEVIRVEGVAMDAESAVDGALSRVEEFARAA